MRENGINRPYRLILRQVTVATIAAILAIAGEAGAGDHWLSRVTVRTPSRPDVTMQAVKAATGGLAGFAATTSQSLFDVTISLDANPQGDDDYKSDDGVSDEAQKAYERRIEEFARAVYQSTNGAHKIRKVTIFRLRDFRQSADVTWDETCTANQGPRANVSGFGAAGKRIWMCTNWPGASTQMPTPRGSGYTLAHEWGHYTYGLYDEYAQEQCSAGDIANNTCWAGTPRGTDTAALPAIMNNQWTAATGTLPAGYTGSASDFLEHSTPNIHPYRSDSTGTNAHRRVFGESAWQTLSRDPATDPKFPWLPARTQYTTVVAPAAPNWIVSEDESTALSDLDIRWVGQRVIDLSIDRSGSMNGTPLANAKTGANLLIEQIKGGTALGVSSFASDVTRNFAIADIPDPDNGVKASAKTAVNAINANGVTSLYDGLIFSLDSVKAFDSNRPGLVYVLSDGLDNASSETESDVISAYQAADVPIVAFAYGSYAPTGTLLTMAKATGGAFYASPTTVAEIQKVLLAADAQFSSNVLLSMSEVAAPASDTTTRTVTIDSTLASARINLAYAGSPEDFDFTLLLPNGSPSGVPFTCEGTASCTATLQGAFLAANGYGEYQVQILNKTGTQKDVTVLVSASPAETDTYDIAVSFSSHTVQYPQDLAIRATVTKGPAIGGLEVTAKLTDPAGISSAAVLLDDGKGADEVAQDGTYSASVPYAADGIYSAVVTASNSAGNATSTYEGINISLREDGTAVMPVPTPITEKFIRVGTASGTVAGVQSDDHVDNPAGGACTQIVDNNGDTSGRIDAAGDADCFALTPSSTSEAMVVRATSLTAGMSPVLTVYDHTGTAQIAQVDLSSSESPAIGATVTIAAADLDAGGMVFVVRDIDSAASKGGYQVSAGPPLTSDADVTPSLPAPFAFAVFGGKGVSLSGSSYVDSYLGEPQSHVPGEHKHGSVGTNSAEKCGIKMSGAAQLYGNATVGAGGNPAKGVCLWNRATVKGEKGVSAAALDLTPVPDPGGGVSSGSLMLSRSKSKTLTTGNYRYRSLSLTGSSRLIIEGQVTLHVDGNISLSGDAKIVMGSGSLVIYANGGKITVSGSSSANTTGSPQNLIIYGSSRLRAISLFGAAKMHALIFAPAADIGISGEQATFGSIMGKTVTLSGKASVHYPEYEKGTR